MIFNDKEVEIKKIVAISNLKETSIKIIFDNEKNILFTVSDKSFDVKNIEKNKTISLIDKIYWDVSLVTPETYYLFDLSKDKVNLTRLDDNLFKLDVMVEKPNIIYCPLGENESFKNLIINTNFVFVDEDDYK